MAESEWRRRWRRFRALEPARQRLLLAAVAALPCTSVLLRVFGYRRVRAWMARSDPRRQPAGDARAIAWCVETAARRGLARPSCLTRSLVLWWLLRRAGLQGDLRIGVRKSDAPGKIEAHAWIERQGQVLNDSPDVRVRYAVFEDLPDLPLNAF